MHMHVHMYTHVYPQFRHTLYTNIVCLHNDGYLFQQAMYAHWSQFTWFRLLYIMFSRYMIINTYEPIDIPIELD